MKKITISASLALLMSNYAFAAEDMKAIEVVSIATKTQKSIDGVAATVDVVTQEDIEKMGASNLGDILSKTSGLVMQYGTFPSASSKSKSSISIRGMGANGTLFLLDGRRLAGEVKNPYDLQRIPASIIQRIEIVKGPMSSLYGADAVGGVINIITKRPTDEMKISYDARYGMNEDSDAQTTNLALSIQGKSNGFGYSAYSSYITTKPYEQSEVADVWIPTGKKPSQTPIAVFPDMTSIKDNYNTDTTYREDSEIYTLGTRLTYDFSSNLTAGIDINYFKEERDGVYIGFVHPSNYKFTAGPNVGKNIPTWNVPVNSHDENNRLDLSVDLEYAPTDELNIKTRIYNSKYEKRNTTTAKYWSDFGYTSEEASKNAAMNADVDITTYEASASYLATDAHLLTGGLEYRDEKRKSSVFTNNVGTTEKKVDYKSIYLQDEWEVTEEFNTILGARYEEISNAEDKPTFRVGGIYEFDKLAKLRANFAQGFRTPDIRELYINMNTPNGPQRGADILGYNLEPESTNAYEIGLGGRNSNLSYDLVIFYNQITNKIQQVQKGAIYTYENVSDANTKGLELSFSYLLLENLSSKLAYNELMTEDEKTKKDLEFNPDRTLMLSFDYQVTKDLNLGLMGKYIGQQHYTKVINEGAPTQTLIPNSKTDAYTLVDLTFGYKIDKMLEIYGGVNNLGNSGVEDILGSNVGRYYFAGLRGSF
ncbi:MAG: TonB-dependent receptor [Sulfurimonas sp.]|uniref:TonB-dependent receptor plug domain-containing protein n=1 Tax=Sulfurimonas sp. TaxID=2022749 RepID=UPI0025D01FB5|nr:TonB-dependent receptor [Sulfurimonas sp.]MCK9491947.1 TonB-dependent receptor [Sulfurimonas sp.]